MARIVVTRPAERAEELVSRLEARGHEVALCPLVALEPVGPDEVDLSPYDWVVVTSRTGAEELIRRHRGAFPRVAAIGPGTAAALRVAGVEPALVAPVSTQEGLLDVFPRPAGRVLFAGAEEARDLLPAALGADIVPLYRTTRLRPASFPAADLVVVASPSAAEALGALAAHVTAVSIGPQTTTAARAAGIEVAAEAASHDLDGLVGAVDEAAARLRSPGA
jgi:uroporphyrinogen-III synthase